MYIPPRFAITDRAVLHELVRTHSFAVIAGAMDGTVRFAYAPTLFFPDAQHGRVQFHLARANPMVAIDSGTVLTLSFLGPHAYISPNWYKTSDQVPTWNYVAAEGMGYSRRLSTDELRRQLEALAAQHEAQISAPAPWTPRMVAENRMLALLDAITGFEVELASLEGKLKLSQNQTRADIAGAIAGLEARGDPASVAVAAAMRSYLNLN